MERYMLLSIILAIVMLTSACGRVALRSPSVITAVSPETTTSTQEEVKPGNYVETITSSGTLRHYRLHIPPTYQPQSPLPLVISLHGYSSNAEQQERLSQLSTKADAVGFIAVYPEGQGSPQSWKFGSGAEGAADVGFIRDIIQHLQIQLHIDPQRVYVSGISNGAEMSYRLACELADTIAAFASVAGGYPPFRDCQPSRPVPVVVFHGTNDNLLPYMGKPPLLLPVRQWAANWASGNGCDPVPAVTFKNGDVTGETWGHCRTGADVVLYTIAGKGHSWPGSMMPAGITTHDINATDTMWAFFAAHPRL